mmetsp:Transcript_16169/g.44769  ORF Transcript_16169/g.44769 Transcript_16169/m.44769 type:complete len:217 (-) Transcript_16169:93-743(-)|eukprot:CAMPEP_0172370126 /NCGR_PEP_ID=MMETSP1060-20121228/36437_1 /TAXON_ID=37318 /ORGANISM="Pseudo-nitzschia pungens, Strain cf. cingulata" /LENGTH=216 /DNA_ID=CAMNT_0013095307 /DNA_START=51 /DNA_END=701 /DNA_ORIENTATION=-
MCLLSRTAAVFTFVVTLPTIPISAFSVAPLGNGNSSNSQSSPALPGPEMNTPARQSLPDHFRLEEIPGKGFGVVTNVRIPAGQVVGDYKGEVMTEEEKDRRYLESCAHLRQPADDLWRKSRLDRGQTITGTYLYGVHVPNQSSQIFVDAEDEYHSLWTRFLNHASPPAANVNPKSLHQGIDGKPRVWFVSIRDIEAGEEICFDYGDDYWLPEDNVV